ncbi:hypothetical protein [Nostoc sp.]|uniref:hypothetical protein n=1 Tax=Nostoc sp. TaxID=1180 RepID=UPI002FF46BB3
MSVKRKQVLIFIAQLSAWVTSIFGSLSSYLRSLFWEAIARSKLITAAKSNLCVGDRRPQKSNMYFLSLI